MVWCVEQCGMCETRLVHSLDPLFDDTSEFGRAQCAVCSNRGSDSRFYAMHRAAAKCNVISQEYIYICSRVHPLIGVRAHTPRAHHHSRPIERVNDSDDMPSVSVERRIHFNEIARYLVQCRASTVIDTTSKWYQRYQPEWVSERAKQQTNNFRPRPFSTIYHTKRTRKMPVYGRVGQSHAYAYTLHTHTGAIMAPFILQSMICTQSVMLCLIADTHTHHILTLAAHSVTHTQHTNKVNRDQFYFRLRAMCVHRHWPLSRAKRNSVPFDVPNTHRLNPMKICVHCTIDLW